MGWWWRGDRLQWSVWSLPGEVPGPHQIWRHVSPTNRSGWYENNPCKLPFRLIIRLLVSGHWSGSSSILYVLDILLLNYPTSILFSLFTFTSNFTTTLQLMLANNLLEFTIYFSTTQLRRCCNVERSLTTWWTRVKHCPCSPKPSTKLREKPTVVVGLVGVNRVFAFIIFNLRFMIPDTDGTCFCFMLILMN